MRTVVIGGQPKRKTIAPRRAIVRSMTLEEVKGLQGHAKFIANDGQLREVKINGAVKTWKTDPNRVEVPVKYGLYEYARLETAEALARFVVVLGECTCTKDCNALLPCPCLCHESEL